MSTAVRAPAFTEPERPENLQIRYATVGGSFVDVTGLPEEDYLFSIREKTNDHAAACRAIPLT
ncbi:hypothetical protein I6J39_34395 (plasmid) [Streptomyces californicus]|uniref:Uncharacterized protein n=1 Tax=Streptomyces californicus TaxID=67351 RepID=A0ABX7JD37_9ACTN|nr:MULTISPECIES: hypothetical protein [Streptomyces]MDW4901334.1 hypothetical protein [Streptomyces californicus]QRV32455.1 hypothetical protein I6J39_34395 [Streptomyces californicus]QRV45871.1 hypothetical protein I6J41_34320 [Streptomyces californicus]